MLVLGLGSQVLVNINGKWYDRALFNEGLSVRKTIFLFDKYLINHCHHGHS